MFLEKQIQSVDDIVSGFEEQLAKEGAILDQKNALSSRNKQLQVLQCIMRSKKVRYIPASDWLYTREYRMGCRKGT